MRPTRLLPFIALFVYSVAYGQDYRTVIGEAMASYQAKAYPQSVAKFEEAFTLEATSHQDLYNGACAAALAEKTELALDWLQRAVDRGYPNPQHMQADADLSSLHDLPRWKEIVAAAHKTRRQLDANIDKPLRAQLRAILDEDQKYRRQMADVEKKSGRDSPEMRALWKITAQKDAENLAKVTAILDTRGWVGPDLVGNDGSNAIFLVIQHANLPTQQKYLPVMRAAVKEKKARPSDLAMLEDRVALGEGRRQTYGSQLRSNPKTGKYELSPLDDPDHVDERRADVGLPPLAEYLKHWALTWNVEEYKKHPPQLGKPERDAR